MTRQQQECSGDVATAAPTSTPMASASEAEALKNYVEQVRGKHARYAAAVQAMAEKGVISPDSQQSEQFNKQMLQEVGE